MNKSYSLEGLFRQQLKDLYSAEIQLVDALPKIVNSTSNEELKNVFAKHLKETKDHKKCIEQIAEELEIDPSDEICEAMKGLIEEAKSLINQTPEANARDTAIIADARRMEHYEISAYSSTIHFAKALDHSNVVMRLQQILAEEKSADQALNEVALKTTKEKAHK